MDTAPVPLAQRSPLANGRSEGGLITIVIPTFNRAHMVVEALDAIAAQTWNSVEAIVVDDGSTDNTYDILSAWRSAHPDFTLRVITQPNRGAAAARNAGVAAANGEFLYFLDSDDLVSPQALSRLISPLLELDAPFSLAHIRNADARGRPLEGDTEGLACQVPGNYFASRWMTHAALYRATTMAAVGPFVETLRRGEDTEHQWRVMATVGPGILLNSYIGVRRIHGEGHLCLGRTVAEGTRDDLAAVSCFLDWAEQRGVKDFTVRRVVFFRSVIAAIRSGHSRDWISHSQAVSLMDRALDGLPLPTRMLAGALRLRSRLIHSPLFLLIILLKGARDRLQLLRNSGDKGGQSPDVNLRSAKVGAPA